MRDRSAFLAELIAAGLFVPSGVDGVYGRGGRFEEIRTRSRGADHAPLDQRRSGTDGVPAAPAESTARADRLPLVVPAPRGDDLLVRRRRVGGARARAAGQRGRGLEQLAEPDCACADPGRVLSGVPRSRGARAAASRAASPSTWEARTSFATSRRRIRRACRCSTSARWCVWASPTRCSIGVTRGREQAVEILARARPRRQGGLASDPFFGRSGKMLARSQRSQALKLEVLVSITGRRADRGRVLQCPPRALLVGVRAQAAERRSRHTRRVSASASSASRWRCSAGTASTRRRGRATWPQSCGPAGAHDGRAVRRSIPTEYQSHPLHADERAFAETNCYADIVIELLHARGDEPTRGARTRGSHRLRRRPVDVLQAAIRTTSRRCSGSTSTKCSRTGPLPEQIAEQIADGRTLIVELDSWYLPDTHATAYRREHVKSSAVMEAIDTDGEAAALLPQRAGCTSSRVRTSMRRFVFDLPTGDDHAAAVHGARAVRRRRALAGAELQRRAPALLARTPSPRTPARTRSPVSPRRSGPHLPRLLEQSHADYHAYAFATVRMAGSAFELCALVRGLAVRRPAQRPRRGGVTRSSRAPRRCRSSSRGAARSTWSRSSRSSAAAWDEAMDVDRRARG